MRKTAGAKAKHRHPRSSSAHRFSAWLNEIWHAYSFLEISLFALGTVSLIGIITILFMPVGKGPEVTVPSGPVPRVGTADFMTLVSQAMNLPTDNAAPVETLVNGDQSLQAFSRTSTQLRLPSIGWRTFGKTES